MQLIEEHVVVQRQRRELHVVQLDAGFLEWFEGSEHGVALHGEQADFRFQCKAFLFCAAAHALVIPDDVVQVEGDLLPRFVADDVGYFFGFHRRQLDEPRQAALPRDGYRHAIAAHAVAREELLQGVANQFGRLGAWLTEDFWIFDEVESLDDNLVGVVSGPASQCLQGALSYVNSPNCIGFGHSNFSPSL